MTRFKQNRHKIPIVYYHSAGEGDGNWSRKFLSLPVEVMEEHFRFISGNFNSIFIGEFYDIRMGKSKPDRRNIIITLDDGYLDNWTLVFPLLQKYRLKVTIFISPEFVDQKNSIRPNYDDFKSGNAGHEDIMHKGFLSWQEMKRMEESGLVDIQSHTITHTKYFVSDMLTGVHHPGGDILYPAGNMFPERKPYYIEDESFEKLLPYGYPLFEEASAVTARRVEINATFITDCTELFKSYDFAFYKPSSALDFIRSLYESYKAKGNLIISRETEAEYYERLRYEIVQSKTVIEEKLNKKVEFLCWPHGDNNDIAHVIAIRAGYLMTTTGNITGIRSADCTRMPDRMAIDLSSKRKVYKSKIKIRGFAGRFPWFVFLSLSRGYHFMIKRVLSHNR
jgi:hypothetical protein